MAASSDIALYVPQLPADPAQWSYDDFVAALRVVDNRSTWAKVRIIGAMARRMGAAGYGLVEEAAREVGLSAATVRNYRALDEAYPVAEFGAPNCPVGVALAFMALDDRKALVSREEPWTVAGAREYAAERAEQESSQRAERARARAVVSARPSAEFGAPNSPKRGRGRPRKAKLPVPAGDDTNAQNRREDSVPESGDVPTFAPGTAATAVPGAGTRFRAERDGRRACEHRGEPGSRGNGCRGEAGSRASRGSGRRAGRDAREQAGA